MATGAFLGRVGLIDFPDHAAGVTRVLTPRACWRLADLLVTGDLRFIATNLAWVHESARGLFERNGMTAVAKRFYSGVLWSPSYFAASCGGAPLEIIKQYVEQQDRPL